MTEIAESVLLPPKMVGLFQGKADVRGARGGRGSAKTRTFAKMTAVRALMWAYSGRRGVILCGRQFMNSLDESSLEEIKGAIRSEPWLEKLFIIGEKFIKTKNGFVEYKFAGLDRSINSVKSKSKILLCWVDEAEPVTAEAWDILMPTLREEDSELWVTWNPISKRSATHRYFSSTKDIMVKVIEMNWSDNPFFPDKLNRQRLRDLETKPEKYANIWEGDFASAVEGAYWAKDINKARAERRIGITPRDPLIGVRAYFDIGFRDSTTIWVVQFVGALILVIDYYEVQRQPLGAHLDWLRENGYGNATIILPHDGARADVVTGKRYEDHISEAGFEVETIPNQGKGAAMKRVEAARKIWNRVCIDEENCSGGIESLQFYHERWDEKRDIGLGPEHDWSSHGADAFGLMAIDYSGPDDIKTPADRDPHRRAFNESDEEESWLTA